MSGIKHRRHPIKVHLKLNNQSTKHLVELITKQTSIKEFRYQGALQTLEIIVFIDMNID